MNNQSLNNQQCQSSNTSDEKLPEQVLADTIQDSLLLEGVNSQDLLQHVDMQHIANILSGLRLDLSNLLNEEVDAFTFQMLCQDMLNKTSQNIKIRSTKPSKSQSSQPMPSQNEISIEDVYSHLTRHYYEQNLQKNQQLTIQTIDTNSKPLSPKQSETKNGTLMMGLYNDDETLSINDNTNSNKNDTNNNENFNIYDIGSNPATMVHQNSDTSSASTVCNLSHDQPTASGWQSYVNQVCQHHKNSIFEPGAIVNDIDDAETKGNNNESEREEEEEEEEDINLMKHQHMTLMGNESDDRQIQFQNLPNCYQDIFNKNVNEIMNELEPKSNDTTTTPDGDKGKQLAQENNEESDNDNDSLIVSDCMTLLGHETPD